MTIDQARKILCRRLGWNYSQKKDEVDGALLGALEEYGARVSIARAQSKTNRTISADNDKIKAPPVYYRIISAVYTYDLDSQTYRRPLKNLGKTTFDEVNKSHQEATGNSDAIDYYTIVGDDIQVGKGRVKTGGTVILTHQRALTLNDIIMIPTGMAIVNGAEAILAETDYRQKSARRKFNESIPTEQIAAQPVKEDRDFAPLNANLLQNQANIDGLN